MLYSNLNSVALAALLTLLSFDAAAISNSRPIKRPIVVKNSCGSILAGEHEAEMSVRPQRRLTDLLYDETVRAMFYYGMVQPRSQRERLETADVIDSVSGQQLTLNLLRMREVKQAFLREMGFELSLTDVILAHRQGHRFQPLVQLLVDLITYRPVKSGLLSREFAIRQTVIEELKAIEADEKAVAWRDGQNIYHEIDFDRLNAIREAYRKLWRAELHYVSGEPEVLLLPAIAYNLGQPGIGALSTINKKR